MAYEGTDPAYVAQLIFSDPSVYPLTAGATEVAYSGSLGSLNLSVGDGLKLICRGTSAANGNNKTIAVKLTSGTTFTVQNNTTTAPNNKDFVIEINIFVRSGNKNSYDARVMFDGIASEIQIGEGTVSLNSGAVSVSAEVTGTTAADVTLSGLQVWKFTKL